MMLPPTDGSPTNLFQVVAESAPAMLWIGDKTGHCVFLNKALRAFWGVADVASFSWNETLHPDDIPMLFGEFARAMAAAKGFEVEARYRRADGVFRILHTKAEPRFDEAGTFLGMVGVNTDVTDQRSAERTLGVQAMILEHMTEGVSLSDETGTIVYTNRAEDELFGYEPGELTGQHVSVQNAYEPDENHAIVAGVIRTLKETGRWSGDWQNRRKDGTSFLTAASITTVEVDGRPHFLCVQRDVTAARRAEERERLLAREVDHRAKNALAVVQSIVRLTPFTDRASYVETITGRIDSMARVHTLLSQNAWTGATIEQVVRAELSPFESAGRFTVEGPDIHLRLEAAQPLTLLLHELATNASKYGALSVPDGRLAVSWRKVAGDNVELTWIESGGPAVRQPERMGFGTRLIRGCAGQLGGAVRKEWRPEGLSCLITIGAPQVRADVVPSGLPIGDRPRPSRLDGSRVLVVEDEILLALEVADYLERAGAVVVGPAQTLKAGLSLAVSEQFDAAVIDMNLGGANAEPLYRMLKAAGIPTVVVTGYEGADLDSPVLIKPVDEATLLDGLARLLAGAPGETRRAAGAA